MLNVYRAVVFAADLRESNQLYREDVDRYDPETNQLQISKVEVGTTIYHNVIVTVKQLLSIGVQEKRSYATTDFDPTDGVLTVVEVFVGKVNYLNVASTIQDVDQVGVP